jgi:hypothetical protein
MVTWHVRDGRVSLPASAHFKLRMMPYPLEPEPLYLIERSVRQHLRRAYQS